MARKDIKEKRNQKIAHIVKTATEVFAEKGYSGASTNEIADLAGISKRSMYYYVGDKETLYASVMKEMGNEVFGYIYNDSDTPESKSQKKSPETRLKKFIQDTMKVANNRQLHAIILREILSGGEFLPGIPEGFAQVTEYVKGILDEGGKKGWNKSINPAVLSLMVLSFFVHWNLVAPVMHRADLWSNEISDFGEQASSALADEIAKIFLKYLKSQ